MNASELLPLLGHAADSPEIEAIFEKLETLRRPQMDDEDIEERKWYDWVLVKRKGVELGFVDQPYFHAEPEDDWGNGPLILCQAYFYNTRDGIAAYSGALPFGLDFSDSSGAARSKLQAFESTRRSHITDWWNVGAHQLMISYAPDFLSIDCVMVKLTATPLSEGERLQPALSVKDWFSLFGEEINSPLLTRSVDPLNIERRMDEDDDARTADFTRECGIELYFDLGDNCKLLKKVRPKALVLAGMKFFRARDQDARQWKGELPYGLNFEDSPPQLLSKMRNVKDARLVEYGDDKLTGYALWHAANVHLHVLYSNVENQLLRIKLTVPKHGTE
jgi:hypothetical protein